MTQATNWQPVLDHFRGGYAQGFDRTALYEFTRDGGETIERFRMEDVSPYFNIAGGLCWRDPLAALRPRETAGGIGL